MHDRYGPEARRAVQAEAGLPTFSRGELPHFAGINTFLKAPYVEDVRTCGAYDVAILGAPFDGGTTYRSGTRFGPQRIRRISALYGPYSFELGVDLRESITIGDLGDVFTIPGNIEKTFDQISKAVGHVFASGAFPVVLGGDHSIGFPTTRAVAEHLDGGRLGIIHFDRHVDTQETDLDERMHTTPWFHATDIPNVPPENLVQIGIGGWQAPRPGGMFGDAYTAFTQMIITVSATLLLLGTRLAFVPVVGIAVLMALRVPQTGILLTLAFDLMLACLLVPFVLGHWWKRAGTAAAAAAMGVGLTVRLVLFVLTPTIYGVDNTLLYVPNSVFGPGFDGWPTFIAFAASLAAFTLTTYGPAARTRRARTGAMLEGQA